METQPTSPTRAAVLEVVLAVARGHGYDGPPPDGATPLKSLGLDSLGVIELVARLEDDLGVVIADEDLVPASFATLDATCHTLAVAA